MKMTGKTSVAEIFYELCKTMIGKEVTIFNGADIWDGKEFIKKDVTGTLEKVLCYTEPDNSKSFYFTVNGHQYDVTSSYFDFK